MNVVEIIFSPTGGTEKVVHIIGGHWSKNTVRYAYMETGLTKILLWKWRTPQKNADFRLLLPLLQWQSTP